MKILKSKKILLSMICALVLVFGSCMTVCAEELEYTLPTSDTYWRGGEYIICEDNTSYWQYDYRMYSFEVSDSWVECSGSALYGTDEEELIATLYGSNDLQTWYLVQEETGFTSSSGSGLDGVTVLYSSKDIYYKGSDEYFFHLVSPIVAVAETIQPESLLVQILGLLPLLIPCLVGLVALRKGLVMLWRHLHKA